MFDADAEYNYENASYIISFSIICLTVFRRNLQNLLADLNNTVSFKSLLKYIYVIKIIVIIGVYI